MSNQADLVWMIGGPQGSGINLAAETLTRWVAPPVNGPAGVITAYLVITGLTTLRASRGLVACMVVGFAVGAMTLAFGIVALGNGGRFQGMPAFPFFLFGLWLRPRVFGRRYGRLVLERVEDIPLVVLPDVFNPVLLGTGGILARTASRLYAGGAGAGMRALVCDTIMADATRAATLAGRVVAAGAVG